MTGQPAHSFLVLDQVQRRVLYDLAEEQHARLAERLGG